MIIKGAKIVNDNFKLEKADITIADNVISSIGISNASGEILDFTGCIVVPGFIDIHNHGYGGYSVMQADFENLQGISNSLVKKGITSYLPTIITDSYENLAAQCSAIAKYKDEVYGSKIVGINLEGPYLSPQKRGVHNQSKLRLPDIEEFQKLQHLSGGLIKIATIAPELDGADKFISSISKDLVVSLGHSNATYSDVLQAFEMGITNVTHFGNACSSFNHRSPGVVGAVFDCLPKNATIELICDGVHLHEAFIRTCLRLFNINQIVLVSDSSGLAGLPDGVYSQFGLDIIVQNNSAKMSDGTIAGSVSDLHSCLKFLLSLGVDFLDAIKTVTINPARVICKSASIGSIAVGKCADLVVLDDKLDIVQVFVNGKLI